MSISHLFSPLKEPENAGVKLPKINLDPAELKSLGLEVGAASVDVLKALAKKGLRKRGITSYKNRDVYYKRALEEIEVLEELGFTDYVLGCWEITNQAHKKNAVIGKGRGSSGGSLVFSLLDITDVDAVKYDLFFERFVSRSRSRKIVDSKGDVWLDGGMLPDCDLDFEKHARGEVIEWIRKRHHGRTAKILTFNTLSAKLAIREAAKFFSDAPLEKEELDAVSDLVPKVHGVVEDLEKAVQDERFAAWKKRNEMAFRYALLVEDLKKNTGVHPSGIAIAHDTISEIIPIRVTIDEETEEETETTAYAMNDTADLAVKYDILGLRTLSIIDGTAKRAGLSYQEIDPESPEIYRYLQDFRHPYGLFQISADTNFVVTQKVKPLDLLELSDVVALARPGALALVDDYVRNKDIPNPTGLNEEFDKILGSTKNVLTYQEQAMKILNKVYGFSLEEADDVRKIIGKKLRDKMPAWEQKIRDAGDRLGVNKKLTDYYWKALLDSADYSFNRSHAIAYSVCSAISVFLKINYPKEFFTECLINAKHEQKPFEEIAAICRELPDFGIQLLPPSLQYSDNEFTIEGNNIRYGLSSIKGIAEKKKDGLTAFRNSPRKTKYEVFTSAKECGVPINVLVNLIYAGTMEGENRSLLALEAQTWNLLTDREKRNLCILGEQYGYKLHHQILELCEKGAIADDGKPIFKPATAKTKSRFETIKEKSAGYREMYDTNKKYERLCSWWAEHSLLGYVHSGRLRDCVMTTDLLSIKEVKDEVGPSGRFQFVGILDDFFVRTSKKGNKYAKFTVSDEETSIEVMMCDSVDNKKLSILIARDEVPAKQDIVIVYGNKSREGDTCFVDSMKIIENPIALKVSKSESTL